MAPTWQDCEPAPTGPTNLGEEALSTLQIGVALAKSAFEVAASTVPWQVRGRRRLSRSGLRTSFAAEAPDAVLLEACGSAHHWGRQHQRVWHHNTLLHPRAVARDLDGS